MKNKTIRWFLLSLAAVLLLGHFSVRTLAAETEHSGFCGVDVTWTYDGEGTLTISGTGDMYHYSSTYSLPWDGLTLRKVIIEDGVTSIGSLAFYGRTRLTSVTIPDSVISIGERAFSYSGLTEITIPDSVTTLGDSAFSECGSLQSVTLGKGLTQIGNNTFYNCSSLTAVAIPNRVTAIGEKAFWSCDALTTVTIGDGVTEIGDRAFEDCSALNTVTFGKNVRNIGWCAFYNCANLASIIIPGSVTVIEGYAFSGCANLMSVSIEDAAAIIGQDAFGDCANLTSLLLGNNVTNIGTRAFYNCGKLKEVVIPDTVTGIGSDVFSGCGSLESVTVPYIGSSQKATPNTYSDPFGYFFGTEFYSGSIGIEQRYDDTTARRCYYIPRLLRSVTVSGGEIPCGAFEGFDWVRYVTLGDGVTGIGEYAFKDCESLTGIVIPNSVTFVGRFAFSNCDSLSTAVIGNGVTEIGLEAFAHCTNLTSVSIGNSVEMIQSYAFSGCRSLTSVTIPDSVTDLSTGAFAGCTGLKAVTLGEGLITIGSSAFSGCSSLMSLTIPDRVISIGEEAIYNCDSLLSVTIGKDVTSIGRNVFNNCASLDHVLYRGTQEQWDRHIGLRFYRATLHVDATGGEVERRETEFGTYYYCNVCEKLLWNDGQVLSVEIQSHPQKLEYFGNRDALDLTGGVVLVRMADGSTLTKPMTELQVSGFDNTVPGECLLTVTVVDKTTTFSVKITTATVTFLDHDGTVISQDEYMYGDTVKVPANPIGREENGETYTFSGWDKPVTAVEGNAVYTAVYSSEKIPYTVEFVDYDGTVISSGIYYYGDAVKAPEAPTRAPDKKAHYEFTGWSAEITECRGNASYTARYQKISHDYYKGEITAPTCLDKGYTTFTCTCGESYVGDYVAATGHDMGLWVELEAPTCTQTGLERRTCLACDYYETQKIRARGHYYKSVVTEPTCTEMGYTTHTCACGDSYVSIYISALGHGWDEGVVTKEPTEDNEGVKTYTCTACGKTKTEKLPVLEHTHKYTETVIAPTCTEKGYTTHTCPCGDSYRDNFVNALGHSFGLWLIDSESVLNGAAGTKHRVCECGEKEYASYTNPLTDVANGKYYSKPVFWAYENGITKGKTATQFQLDADCTRKQIVMFLWRAAGQPEPDSMENPFVDVKADSFQKAILWAYYEGITSGKTATEFQPEAPCTREQIVMFLWRYFGKPEPKSMKNPFTDVKVGGTFEKAILWAYYEGITTGKTSTTFEPQATCTRGQIVTFLYRAMVE